MDSGEKYWVPTHGDVIHFRLEKRQELMLDFSMLSPQTVIAIVGKFDRYILFITGFPLVILFLGSFYFIYSTLCQTELTSTFCGQNLPDADFLHGDQVIFKLRIFIAFNRLCLAK